MLQKISIYDENMINKNMKHTLRNPIICLKCHGMNGSTYKHLYVIYYTETDVDICNV